MQLRLGYGAAALLPALLFLLLLLRLLLVLLHKAASRCAPRPKSMSLFGDYLSAFDSHAEAVIGAGQQTKQRQRRQDEGAEDEQATLGYSDYIAALFWIFASYVLSCCTFIVWWSWLQKEMSLPAWKSSLDGFAFQSKKIWNNPGGKGRGAVHPSVLVWSFSFWVTTVAVIHRLVMPHGTVPRLCAVAGAPLRAAYVVAPCLAMIGGSLRWREMGKEWALEGNDGADGDLGATDGIRSEPPIHSATLRHGDL